MQDAHHRDLSGPQTTAMIDRRTILRFFAATGALAVVPSALSACSTDSNAAKTGGAAIGTSLTWAIGNGLTDLDSVKNFQAGNWTHTVNTYEAPMRITDNGTIEACLASSWQQPDPTTVVLTIRDGVTFQDGTAMTADDVAFSLARNLDPKQATGAGATYYGSVASIKATGEKQVTVKLKAQDPLILLVLGSPAALITSRAYFTRAGSKFGTPAFPGLGTGPYGFVSFDPATGYELKAHNGYWGGKPALEKFTMKFIEDTQARLLAFQNGDLDGTNDVPSNNLQPWKSAGHVQYLDDYLWFGWSFQVDVPPWNDINVRKAVAYATDSDGLVAATTSGQGSIAKALIQPQLFANLADQADIDALYGGLPSYAFDLDKARQALAASGHAAGFSATTTVPNSFPELKTIALNTAENLKQIGITLTVKEIPEEQIFPFWLNLPPEHAGAKDNGLLCRLLPAVQLPDPADALGICLPSGQTAPGGQNSAGYRNSTVDALFERQRTATKKEDRFAALSKILTIAQQDLPYHGAFVGGNSEALRKGIKYANLNSYTFLKPWIPTIVAE